MASVRMATMIGFMVLAQWTAAQQCPPGEVHCDGQCRTKCDGVMDCSNGADETQEMCSSHQCRSDYSFGGVGSTSDLSSILGGPVSGPKMFRCDYGGCINDQFVCNGRHDCWDKSDEDPQMCQQRNCRSRQFRCAYGACISRSRTCNGIANCHDASDETTTLCRTKTCYSRHFQCGYGACIDVSRRCNGVVDCHDGSDEDPSLCGPSHTSITTTPYTIPTPSHGAALETTPVLPTPPATPPPTPPVTPPPTPPATPRPPPPATPRPPVTCEDRGLCSCPHHAELFCVPCDNVIGACAAVDLSAMCSTDTKNVASVVTLHVLYCGDEQLKQVPGIVRTAGAPSCGNSLGVPQGTVALAGCWGVANLLAKCHSDGTWRTYGYGGATFQPIAHLCQFDYINPPVCGMRAQYSKASAVQRTRGTKPQWPWLVQVHRFGAYACTGTIITPNTILTAAHCLAKSQLSSDSLELKDIRIEHLNHRSIRHRSKVRSIHLYPSYEGGTRPKNDIAIVKLQHSINYSDKVYPACLHRGRFPVTKIAATFIPVVQHFYWDLSLQEADARCYSPLHCFEFGLQPDQFCGIDQITHEVLPQGSSGGPYLVNLGNDLQEEWVVAGVVSSFSNRCGRPNTIFTILGHYEEWINNCTHEGRCS